MLLLRGAMLHSIGYHLPAMRWCFAVSWSEDPKTAAAWRAAARASFWEQTLEQMVGL